MRTLTFDIETVPQDNLEPYQITEYRKVMKTNLKRFFPDGNYTLSELKDIRNLTMAVSPFLGKIVVIGLHYKGEDGVEETHAIYGYDERTLLVEFWSTLSKLTKTRFISFNGLNFDVPFILKRSLFHRVTPTNNDFMDLRRFSQWPHYDVKMMMGDWDKYATGTLDLISNFLSIPSPKEGKVAAKDVYYAYKNKQLKEVADYCLRDVVATFEVYSIMKDFTHNPFKNYGKK